MGISVIIHTENKNSLFKALSLLDKHPSRNKFSLLLHCKDYIAWEDQSLNKLITSFREYYAYPTQKNSVSSVVELITRVKDEKILLLDENVDKFDLTLLDEDNFSSLFFRKKDLFNSNLDTKYQTIKWFIIDLLSQIKGTRIKSYEKSDDSNRYLQKINSPLLKEKIIYIDGGLGDHVMALPLLEKIGKDVYVSCKYQFVYEHLPIKGFVHWTDELFGGYNRFVYSFGSDNNCKTIIDAFFELYGVPRDKNDILVYNGNRTHFDLPTNSKIALICTSAAKVGGVDSNKDWRDVRWMKLIHELQKNDYYVIQVGSLGDNQIPNVNLKFLDKSLGELSYLIDNSSLWISVDTFFHHFASSIKPDVGICLTPFYNDHAKHPNVKYVEKDCGKNFSDRKWWLDSQQHERKECMDLIQVEDVLNAIKKKIKVKIYCGDINFDNCANWRGFMQYKNIEGIEFEISSALDFNINNDITYDVIMMIRPLNGLIDYIRLLKSYGVKVIVDYDDSLPLSFNSKHIVSHLTEVIQIMNESDGITTTTKKLKHYYYYHSYNENINVIPNMIDEDVVSKNKKDNGEKIILGWFGNSGHYDNLILINESVLKILDDYDNVYLNVYSDSEKIFDLFEHPKTNKINYLFNFKTFQENLGDIDINLAPMVDSYFNLHKSNIRIILTGYKGIPSVASNFSEYKDLGDNVVLCDKKEDWYDGIKSLIENKEYRNKIGNKIQDYVENNLTSEKWKKIKYNMFYSIVNTK